MKSRQRKQENAIHLGGIGAEEGVTCVEAEESLFRMIDRKEGRSKKGEDKCPLSMRYLKWKRNWTGVMEGKMERNSK